MKIKNYIQLFLLTSFISTSIVCTTQYSQPGQNTDNQSQLTTQEEVALGRMRNQSLTRKDREKRLNRTPEQDEKKKWFARFFHTNKKTKQVS
jgi:hypothetical protein